MNHERQGPGPDRRRSADRILDTAEGVLITLRRYHLNQAFFELAQTARRHAIPPVSLADALVALAQQQPTHDCEPRAVQIAQATWGALLDRNTHNRAAVHEPHAAQPQDVE